jgi:hypothetical protein
MIDFRRNGHRQINQLKRRKGFANSQTYNLKRVLERSHKAPCDLE